MSPPIRPIAGSQMAVFLINSRLGLLSAAPCPFKPEPHFSRSYVRILPSSLTRVRSSALDCSSHPRVSVYGTVRHAYASRYFLSPWLRPLRLSFPCLAVTTHLRRSFNPFLTDLQLRPELPFSGRTSPHASRHRNMTGPGL